MLTQLLCTFTIRGDINPLIQQIRDTYVVVYNYIYVLQNKSSFDELFVTYNINSELQPKYPLPNTILIHRKKETNTLYTINALNTLIVEENDGVLDTEYVVDWAMFKNCMILTGADKTRKINTKIYDIIKVDNE